MADTNVLVAAAIAPRGTCGHLLDAAIDGRWTLVLSPKLVSELDTVLARDKFRRWLSLEDAHRLVAGVQGLAVVVADPPVSSTQVTADPKDEFVVALARVASVVALVSGDPHLTGLLDPDPRVLTPAAFRDRLAAGDA